MALAVACTRSVVRGPAVDVPTPAPGAPLPRALAGAPLRVELSASVQRVQLSGTGAWRMADAGGSPVATAGEGETWSVEQVTGGVRAQRSDGATTPVVRGALRVEPLDSGALLTVGGHRYRGTLTIVAGDDGLMVINRLPVEEYLRGVVPMEIGTRADSEQAAVEAQAIVARTFALSRLTDASHPADVRASVLDQVYGGVDAETPASDRAVARTAGLVVLYHGRLASTPYHSTCGGRTAAAEEVWRSEGEPYLRPVSDRIPGTDRYYCDPSPRFAWTAELDRATLDADVARYLARYAAVPPAGTGRVRAIVVHDTTPSGRVRSLDVTTTTGTYALRGNDIRFVLRPAGGALLNSTYFSVHDARDADGALARLRITGRGYGHGVGMCQWGAIGRARAGQDARTIIQTYFPGTSIGPVPGAPEPGD
ncbi:MAG TPA: SpoIID/LytB domain-containing protein [Gemmatimonadaceae bacterium]|nr:SpoIID/LytB domain-containing protein [Gemmatimonadaceae bacterium]